MADFPIGDPHCPDCHGTGRYQGLGAEEPCRTCGEKEGDNASLEDVLDFGDLGEELFPGAQDDDAIQELPTVDAAPGLLDPNWDDASEFVGFRHEVLILDDPEEVVILTDDMIAEFEELISKIKLLL